MKNFKSLLAASALLMAAGQASATVCAPGDSASDCSPPPGAFIDLAGQAIPQVYQLYTANFLATSATTTLTFAFRSDPGYIQLDDVSLLLGGAGPNLVTNGGFEGTTYQGTNQNGSPTNQQPTGWVYSNPNNAGANGGVSNNPNSGLSNYSDGSVGAYDFLSQDIATIVGSSYTLSFYAYHPGGTSTFQDSGSSTVDLLVYANVGTASASVPEPGSMALLGLGIAGLALARRRKQK